jgi:hypothetical protein
VLALAAAGCRADLDMTVDLDRGGRGSVDLRLTLDRGAQQALGLDPGADPSEEAQRFAPLLGDAGWQGGDGQIAASREDDGTLVLETHHAVDSPKQLEDLLSQKRPIATVAPDAATFRALTDLPADSALLNSLDIRLGDKSGDNPGFHLFARGGVGDIGDQTCAGDDVTGVGRALRDALTITYRFRLPGGPGSTNADDTPKGENVWRARYGDCPPLRADSGGGSSSTLVNGLILAGLTGVLVIVFALRGLRRRRGRGEIPR